MLVDLYFHVSVQPLKIGVVLAAAPVAQGEHPRAVDLLGVTAEVADDVADRPAFAHGRRVPLVAMDGGEHPVPHIGFGAEQRHGGPAFGHRQLARPSDGRLRHRLPFRCGRRCVVLQEHVEHDGHEPCEAAFADQCVWIVGELLADHPGDNGREQCRAIGAGGCGHERAGGDGSLEHVAQHPHVFFGRREARFRGNESGDGPPEHELGVQRMLLRPASDRHARRSQLFDGILARILAFAQGVEEPAVALFEQGVVDGELRREVLVDRRGPDAHAAGHG